MSAFEKVEVNEIDFLSMFKSKFNLTCKQCGSDRVSVTVESENEPHYDLDDPVQTRAYLRIECCDCTNHLEEYESAFDDDTVKK